MRCSIIAAVRPFCLLYSIICSPAARAGAHTVPCGTAAEGPRYNGPGKHARWGVSVKRGTYYERTDENVPDCLPPDFSGGLCGQCGGGGGLITLPAYMMAGVPVHFAAGTNKVVNGIGTATATLRFFRSGKIRLLAALCAALGALRAAMRGRRSPSCSPRTC